MPVHAFRRAACARATPCISSPMMAARRAGRATPVGGTARAAALVQGALAMAAGKAGGMRAVWPGMKNAVQRELNGMAPCGQNGMWHVACGAGRNRRGWRTRLPRPAPPAAHAYHMITRCSGGRYIASPGLMSNAS